MYTEQLHGHEAERNLKLQASVAHSHRFRMNRLSWALMRPLCPLIAGHAFMLLARGYARQRLQHEHAWQKRGLRTFVWLGEDQRQEARDDHPGLSKHDAHCLQQCEV